MLGTQRVPPLCSVIVPAYSCVCTLEATLQSAQRQSVADIEIIVVDDGSTDGTRALLSRLGAEDPRIRCVFQANQGVSAARNAGILRARAPVIACLDADDLWPTDHLAVHLQRLSADARLGVSFSSARFIASDGSVVGAARPRLTGLTAADMLAGNPTTTCSTWVVRRQVFAAVGLFNAALRRCEDQEWLVRAALAGVGIKGTAASSVSYRTAATGLAGDLGAMRAGFVAMLAAVALRAPDLVERAGKAALAHQDLYLARQALRLGLHHALARKHVWASIRHAPQLIIQHPRQTLGTLLGSLWPSARVPASTAAATPGHAGTPEVATAAKTLAPHAPVPLGAAAAPAVSVVIPLYQTERYIADALRSVLAQTFTDFEVLVIDDGSTDQGPAIARSMDDPRVQVITQANRGLAGARNTGIRLARAPLIALLDADDLWHPEKLASHVAHLQANPDLGVSFSDSRLIDAAGAVCGALLMPLGRVVNAPELFCRNPIGNGSTPVLRRAALDAIAFHDATLDRTCWFDESFRQSEDIDCWMRIAATTPWLFGAIPRTLTDYRLTQSGLSANVDQQIATWRRFRAKVRTYAPDLELAHGRRAEGYQLRYLARRAVKSPDRRLAAKLIHQALWLHPIMLREEPRQTLVTWLAANGVRILPRGIYRRCADAVSSLMAPAPRPHV